MHRIAFKVLVIGIVVPLLGLHSGHRVDHRHHRVVAHKAVVVPRTTTTTNPPPVTTTTVPPPAAPVASVTATIRAGWVRVATCEEGGTATAQRYGLWFSSGSAYPDSLGIDAANWWGNGGTAAVTETAQIAVAERIQTYPPPEDPCAAW